MSKINQEEYEVLKGLDDGYKCIMRNFANTLMISKDDPSNNKHHRRWNFALGDHKFQSIKPNCKPHNIAELIEEYEVENGMRYDVGKTKVVVDVDTSKLETHIKDLQNLPMPEQDEVETPVETISLLENALKENKRLGRLVEKKQEEVDQAYKDGYEKGKEYMVEKHRKSKPVIPSFVAEWIENKKENEWGDLFDAMRELLNIPLSGHQESGVARWIRKAGIEDFGLEFEDVLAKLWLDGYEVAEESKYRLKLNGDYLSSAQIDYEADKGNPMEVIIHVDVNGFPYNFSEDEKSYVEKYLNVEVEELEE